jgi:hypothetical protein
LEHFAQGLASLGLRVWAHPILTKLAAYFILKSLQVVLDFTQDSGAVFASNKSPSAIVPSNGET